MRKDTNTLQNATTNSPSETEKPRSYRVQHILDDLIYPQLDLKVCLSGPPEDRVGFLLWLGRAGCRFVSDPLKADLVIFTGGADVNPAMYGEKPIAETHYDVARDAEDSELYTICRENKIPMLGICRGAQFLWVKKGGKLYQHVNNHNDGVHDIFVFGENKKYRASSVHHQMCRTESIPGFKLLANCAVSDSRKADSVSWSGPTSDFEIYAFPQEAILGIQGHPEYQGFPNYSAMCIRLIEQYIYNAPNTVYIDGKLRINPVVVTMEKK